MEEIVNKFHNLPGDSVPEHYKQFNFYLRDLENENIDISELLPLLQPKNLQEEIFYLKLLFRFERNEELLATLLKADKILNHILVKNHKFIRLFNNIPADSFVENICPNISYVTRNNIIYKLSFAIEDVNVGESYYTNVKNKYGFKIASPLLLACREETLMEAVSEYEIKLKDRQLIAIHKKYPEFCKFYFKKHNIFYHYDILGQYLCINDLNTFHELLQFGTPNVGKRAFLRFLKSYKEDVIKTPLACNLPLRFKVIYKHLTHEEFAELFKNLFPKTLEFAYQVINENIMKSLKLIHRDARGKLLFNTFKELYGFDMWSDSDYFNPTLLEILSLDDRLKFKLDDDHIEMYGIDKSIPTIKSKINLTQAQDGRRELVEKLVKTCKINNDLDALLDVLRYFCKRHKNDVHFIRTSFVQCLNDSFTLEKLSAEHWECIDEIMLLFEVNGEYWYNKAEIYKKSIVNKIKNNLDYSEMVKGYYKERGIYDIQILQEYPTHEKAVMLSFPNLIETVLKDQDRKTACTHFLDWIASYNMRYPEDTISIFNFADIIKEMLKLFKDNKYFYSDNAFSRYILRCPASNDEEQALIDEVVEGFLQSYSFFCRNRTVMKLIHTKPSMFLKHSEMLLQGDFVCEPVFYELSKMHYTELYKKVCEVALKFLDEKKCSRICAAISFLSFVKPENFEEIVQKFLPKAECKIDVHADEMKETLQIQRCILKCFKNFSRPADRIETILHFCNRDYLQYALEPLYFTLYHAPEKAFEAPVTQLLDRAVSVRKHTIYLTTTLGSTIYIYDLLKQLGETEKNVSLRKFIFKRTFKKFVEDQSEDFWELTREHFKLLDVQDTESLDLILTVRNIPEKYIPSYVKVLWDYLKQRGENMEFKVLRFINEEILKVLSDECCDEIIKSSLLNEKNLYSSDVFNVVTKYLILSGDKLDHRMDIIWNCINRLHESADLLDKAKKSKQVYEFLEVTCSYLLGEKQEHSERLKEIIQKMSDKLDELQIPCNKYEIKLIFELTDFYFTLENDQMKCLAEIILKQQSDATEKYGAQMASFYGSFISGYILTLFIYMEGERTEQYLSLVENLLEINDTQEVRLLCLRLLPRKISKKPAVNKRQRDMFEKIGTDATPLVEVQLFKLLRHLEWDDGTSNVRHGARKIMEKIVYKFHNLLGDSVPEHYKQFNFYLQDLENENIDISELLPLLQPENRQEEIFYLKLLIRFERNEELFATLLKADRILNHILVKNHKFIRLFNNIPADSFVENICPNISYVTRNNIIYKFSFAIEDVNVGESYYTNVKNKYGFKIASPLLLACREETLMEAVTEYEIKLKDRQLIAIHKKYPEFCKFYFKKHNIFNHYDILGQYLCINDLNTFHELLQFGTPNVGKRAFLKFLKNYKEDVIKNPLACNLPLRFKLIHKHLTQKEFAELFKNLFPKTLEFAYQVINENIMKSLKLLHRDARGKLLFNTFKELYGFDMWSDSDYFNPTLLEILSLDDCLKFKLDDDHIEMYGIDKSIPTIKNKINLTQAQDSRRKLVEKLVKTCKINNDLDALLNVLRYFCKRHKNDVHFIRTSFMQCLNDSFTLEKLSAEHWECIDEIMLLFEVNGEYWYNKAEIYKKSIVNKVKNNLDYSETVKRYYKERGILYDIPILQEYPTHEKALILSFPNLIETALKDMDRKTACSQFLDWLASYNMRYPEDTISIFNYADIIKAMLEGLKDNRYFNSDNSFKRYILRCPAGNDEEQALIDEVLEVFLQSHSFFCYNQTVIKLIQIKPSMFLKHSKMLLEGELLRESFFYELSKMHYSELYKKVCEDALKSLDEKKCSRICAAISFLSFAKPENFEEIVQKFLPKAECKIDVHADEMKETLEIQRCILKCFKNFSRPGDRIETILYFCNRDYFQYALEPLYFTLYHAPEKSFEAPVMQLLDRAVSVRKHTIFLTTTLGSTTYIYDLLKQLGETEKNVSLRKFIFKRTFKKFVEDQSEDFRELTREHFKLLDVQDTESLDLILTVRNIPEKYIPSYVKVLWDYLKQRGENMEFKVLRFINEEILKVLSDECCDEIIKSSLLNEKNLYSSDVFNVVTKYLILSGDKLDHRMEIIWNCINRLHESADLLDKAKKSKQVYEFLEVTCSYLLGEKQEHSERLKDIIQKMSDKLDELQIPCNKYEIKLIFELTDFYFTLENDQMKCLAEIILKQQSDAIEKYGAQMASFYGSFISGYILTLFIYMEGERTEQYLSLVENLLEINDTQEVRLLCLRLLPRKISKKPAVNKRQREMFEKIGMDATPLVEVQLFKLLRHLEWDDGTSNVRHGARKIMEKIVYKFHNLPGDSVPEYYKQFNFYLRNLENENIDISKLLPLLQPENRQEEIFYLKLLIRFERNEELLATLLKADRILNHILVKNHKFIRLFNNIPADLFVENICPNISYVTRNNIIYKLSFAIEDVNVGESYYTNVKNKYGFKIASPLLLACREETLMEAVTEYEIKLKDRQLIAIHKKYPEFCKFYFKKHNRFNHYDILGQYLCINDLNTFHELLQFGTPNVGKRAFLKFVKSYKEDVIKNPLACNLPLRFKVIYKHLTHKEFAELFKNLFPKTPEFSHEVINENIMKSLMLLPVDARGKLLSNTFNELYGVDYFNITVLEILSLENRLNFKLDDDHIELYGIDKSIPEIKSKIHLTRNQNSRRELVEKLVKTCKINNDLDALLDVLRYFCERHKNDIQFIRTSFIQSLNDNFTLEKLSIEHWKYIDEIMLLFEVKGEYWYGKVEIYRKSIEHKIKNNLDYFETIKYLFKAQGTYDLQNLQDYPEQEKNVILSFPNLIKTISKEEDRKYAEKHFLEWVGSYNIRHSQDIISIFNYPDMIKAMLQDLKDNEYPYSDTPFSRYIIKCKPKNEEEQALIDEIIEGFLQNPSFFYAHQTVLKLLHTKPSIFLKYTDEFLESEVSRERLYYELSKMHYTELYKKVCEAAIKFLDGKECSKICGAIGFLSFVKPENFEEIVWKYLPKAECKIDIHADGMQDTLEIQRCIVKCFKNFNRPGERIKMILHFCNRDYLQYALEPLYFTLYHAPEKAFEAPVMQLLDGAVSVRKHTIYLTTTLGSTTYIYDLLKQLGETEKNVSLRKFIFKRTYKKFVEDQSEYFWELTREHFKLLDVQDTESLDLILTVRNIPEKYIPSYVKVLWDYLKQRGENMEFKVLRFINEEILKVLSDECCDEIIKSSLLNEKNLYSTDVYNVLTKYLILSGDKLDHRLEIIWNCINRLHESVDLLDKAKKSKQVYEFLEVTCSYLLGEKQEHSERLKEIIQKMSDKLDELQIPCNKYEIKLIFELTDFYFTLENNQMKCLAEIILKQQFDAIEKYGVQVANFYGSFISGYLLTLFNYMEGERNEQYLSLVENLLEINNSQEVRLLCLGLLPRKISKKPVVNKQQRNMLEKIGTDATPLVQVQLFKLLRHLDL